MPIDEERAKRFNDDIRAIIDQLDFSERYEVFRARLLDLIAKRELEGETLRSYITQITSIFDKEFIPFVGQTHQLYNETVQLVNSEYKDISIDIHRDLDRIQAIERTQQARLGQYKAGAVREISRTVRRGIASGQNSGEIARSLSRSTDDKVKTFANTLARTQVRGYGQALKTEKARLGKVYFFTYWGIERESTRAFCLELLRQGRSVYFHVNDIIQMDNGHRLSVQYYQGGYNCHHDWEPDPFADKTTYSVSFYTRKDGSKTLKLARYLKLKLNMWKFLRILQKKVL